MASYNANQLTGEGTPIESLPSSSTYDFELHRPSSLTGSCYFTMETKRNGKGEYDSTRPTNAVGVYNLNTGTGSFAGAISSSHIFSVVVQPTPDLTSSFTFTPTANIAVSSSFLRATGGMTLNLSPSIYSFFTTAELQTAVDLWISDNAAALATYGEINTWDVSAVTDMASLFSIKTTFNSDISNWDVSNVTDMNNMFRGAVSFDQPLNGWDVSNVTAMNSMFSSANSFNQPIGGWTLSSVIDMNNMFTNASSFNQPLNGWDVSNVTNMSSMFNSATAFNGDIGSWDVSNVTIMASMFGGATTFNKPLNNWDVSNVTNMAQMFSNADAFQQPLNLWEPNSLSGVFGGSGFMGVTGAASAITYNLLDTLLNGWVVDFAALQSNVTISFGDSTFTSAGLAARNILVNDKGWTITDGGQV